MRYRITNNEKGVALVVGTLLLLVATAVGVIALSTSTTNVMISGNQRLSEINFAAADSGVSVSIPVIKSAIFERDIASPYGEITVDISDTDPSNGIPDFIDELVGELPVDNDTASKDPNLSFLLGNTTVNVDVDYLYRDYAKGTAIEYASGYEGIGKGAGGKGSVEVYYAINSLGIGNVGSETEVCAIYRDK
ncbi:MAG: PilX N-terminal domain-containing pilus assembly protein [Nitrospirota bacterium]|nr:PilX N-terminal domain-containing pilus assembly protein [Nitrospirota bacterium]